MGNPFEKIPQQEDPREGVAPSDSGEQRSRWKSEVATNGGEKFADNLTQLREPTAFGRMLMKDNLKPEEIDKARAEQREKTGELIQVAAAEKGGMVVRLRGGRKDMEFPVLADLIAWANREGGVVYDQSGRKIAGETVDDILDRRAQITDRADKEKRETKL